MADSLPTYVDQRYKVCPEVIIPNVTAQPNRSNVTFCWGDGNASNATNGTCAFVGNGTNASVYETWAWGWPYRANVPVDGGGTPLVQYASPTHLAIGGAGWVEAEAARGELFLTGEPNLPVDGAHHQLHHSVAGRRLGEGGGAASNALERVAPLRIALFNATCEEEHGIGAPRCELPALGGGANASNATYNPNTTREHNSCNVTAPPPLNLTADDNCTWHTRRIYSESTVALLDGIVSAGLEPRGWARVISPALHGDMLALNGSSLTLHLPPQPRYDVHAPETISVQLPAAALRSGRPLVVNGTALVAAAGGVLVVSGTLLDHAKEAACAPPTLWAARCARSCSRSATSSGSRGGPRRLGGDGGAPRRRVVAAGRGRRLERGGEAAARRAAHHAARRVGGDADAAAVWGLRDLGARDAAHRPAAGGARLAAARRREQLDHDHARDRRRRAQRLVPRRARGRRAPRAARAHARSHPPRRLVGAQRDARQLDAPRRSSAASRRSARAGDREPAPPVDLLGERLARHQLLERDPRHSGWNDVVQRALVVARVDDATLRITLPSVGEMVDGRPAFDIREDEVVRITPRARARLARATRLPSARCCGSGRAASRCRGRCSTARATRPHSRTTRRRAASRSRVRRRSSSCSPPTTSCPPSAARRRRRPSSSAASSRAARERRLERDRSGAQPRAPHAAPSRMVRVDLQAARVPDRDARDDRRRRAGTTVESAQVLRAPAAFELMPTPGAAVLSGKALTEGSEVYLAEVEANRTLVVTLAGDAWDVEKLGRIGAPYFPSVPSAPDPAVALELIEGFQSAQGGDGGFNAILAPNRTDFIAARAQPDGARGAAAADAAVRHRAARDDHAHRAARRAALAQARWWRRPTGSCCRARACRACARRPTAS